MNLDVICLLGNVSVVVVGPCNDWIGLHDGHMDQVEVIIGEFLLSVEHCWKQ